MRSTEVLRSQQVKLKKLKNSPYFGRFDFQATGDENVRPIYVGVHDFQDAETTENIVYDWRAPISAMFYDFEIGTARYTAPSGEITGDVRLKRQFRIRNGLMDFVIESSVNIIDDVLQEELSRSSDEGMKNIVATIQRDQNAIIRDADIHTLLIQSVAGSGKTSIALHRIAFLLYRFKDTLTSDDILILSPNRVFADYIGNVLPELGEEQVSEIGMEDLAEQLLDHKYRFQSFFEQTALLLEKDDPALKERISAKASPDFLRRIQDYVKYLEKNSFEPAMWKTGRNIVPDWFFAENWQKHRSVSHAERVARVVAAAEHQIGIHYNYDLRTDERRSLREAVKSMARKIPLREAYRHMFDWIGQPDLFRLAGGKLEYGDVFPLIYLKMLIEGLDNPYKEVKHLLVDEMQDYTPVQYAVLGKLFPCRKTILGDATQSVNPYGASTAEQIQQVLRSAPAVHLTKSYRSTWEIMQFALQISPNDQLVPMKRHGKAPKIIVCKHDADIITQIVTEAQDFETSSHQTLAIIVKTQKTAKKIHRKLEENGLSTHLFDIDSVGYSTGIVVCSTHLAKGLEFDRVIVPDADDKTYCNEMDRNLLYVSCTRAMHRLTLTAKGNTSTLLPLGHVTTSH